MINIESKLAVFGGKIIQSLTTKNQWRVKQRWREYYARILKNQTGSWQIDGKDWHVFTHNYTQHFTGAQAIEEYLIQRDKIIYITQEYEGEPGISYLCEVESLPTWPIGLYSDFYIFPESYSWTIVFTHEHDSGLGPFFSYAYWQEMS